MRVIIRPATPADRPELARMLREVLDYFEALAPDPLAEQPTADDLWATSGLSFTDNPVCATLIPEVDGRIAGYLAYHFGVWEIYAALFVAGLYVRPEYQRGGVGRALMDEVRVLARARGATRMTWEVWRLNPRAIAFYESLGAEGYDDNLRMAMKI
ncbi:MAG: GNAT family N-acetyltransferase [Hyphomicrobiaceae bacterium]